MTRKPTASLPNEEAPSASAIAPRVEKSFFDEIPVVIPDAEPWRLSHLMLAVAGVAVLLWLGINLGAIVVVFAPLVLIALGLSTVFVMARLRASRQEALLALLAIASERGMPLPPAIEAFADQFRGRSQRRILAVAGRLRDGKPLHLALVRPFRIVSRDASLMARIGDECDRLGGALRLVSASRAAQTSAWSAITGRLAYLLWLVNVAESVSGWLLYFIVPKFEAIFSDFGVPFPEITRIMISGSKLIYQYFWIAFPLFILQFVLLIFLPFSFGGWVNYRIPIFDRFFGRRHTALVLRALSVVIEADRPIGLGLEILKEQYPANWFQRRISRASSDVLKGADWIDALWRRGVIRRSDAEVLASAATVGNLVWACRELADTAERRQRIRSQMLIQALFPLAVITIGIAVAIICLGYFVPLVRLIQTLSEI